MHFFRNVRFFHDAFHQRTHVRCGPAYRSRRSQDLPLSRLDDTIMERLNAFLKGVRRSASRSTVGTVILTLMLSVSRLNKLALLQR